jgi:hypothetical protein
MGDDGVMYTGPRDDDPDGEDADLLRHELERRRRVARRDQVSWRIVAWVMAGALGLLSYDSGGAALDAHRAGRPWLYPAVVSAACALLLIGLIAWALRRTRG